jgi:hypothetical protein
MSAGRRIAKAASGSTPFSFGGRRIGYSMANPFSGPVIAPKSTIDQGIRQGDKVFQQGDFDPAKIEGDKSVASAQAEEAQKQALRDRVNTMFSAPDLKTQEGEISGALRGNYSDELKRRYQDAERELRFGAARTGNIGSTDYADESARINRENELGGTNIEGAVRRSIANLRGSREDTRARSIGLINAGEGTEGVQSATQGLALSADTARNANRERLFDDLFQNLAYSRVASNQSLQAAQLAALLNRGGGSSFSATSPNSGRVI